MNNGNYQANLWADQEKFHKMNNAGVPIDDWQGSHWAHQTPHNPVGINYYENPGSTPFTQVYQTSQNQGPGYYVHYTPPDRGQSVQYSSSPDIPFDKMNKEELAIWVWELASSKGWRESKRYSETFRLNNVSGEQILKMKNETLRDDLNIWKLGHRLEILRSVRELRVSNPHGKTKVERWSSTIPKNSDSESSWVPVSAPGSDSGMKSEQKIRRRPASCDEMPAARVQVSDSETSVTSGSVTVSVQQPKIQNTKQANEDIPFINVDAEPLSIPAISDQTRGRKSTVAMPDAKSLFNNEAPLIESKMKSWEEADTSGGRM